MNKESIAILKLTRGDIYNLAGDRNRKLRQELMYQLTGEKLPIAKCGITAIEKIVYNFLNVSGEAGYHKEKALKEYLITQV